MSKKTKIKGTKKNKQQGKTNERSNNWKKDLHE